MKDKGVSKKVKIILKDKKKYFCHWDVDSKGDLVSQGCRLFTDEPDVRI